MQGWRLLSATLNPIPYDVRGLSDNVIKFKSSGEEHASIKCLCSPNTSAAAPGTLRIFDRGVKLPILGKIAIGIKLPGIWVNTFVVKDSPGVIARH